MKNADKHLTTDALVKKIRGHFKTVTDPRERAGTYELPDVMLSGLGAFYFKSPSLLKFDQKFRTDRVMTESFRRLFGVRRTPSDTQIAEVMDRVPSEAIKPAFDILFEAMRRGNRLKPYRFMGDRYILDLDGSEYFRSGKIACPGCLRFEMKVSAAKAKKRGAREERGSIQEAGPEPETAKVTQYAHKILQAAIVHPDMREVIPLAAEQIRNADGMSKQDCELNAARRFLADLRRRHPRLELIVNADGLFSHTPFIRLLEELSYAYILVVADGDHKSLVEDWEGLARGGLLRTLKIPEQKGGFRLYTWTESVALSDRKDAARANILQVEFFNAEGKRTYFNRWATNLPLDSTSVVQVARAGRVRWKIENEVFNTLKNGGYNIDHNFGHGKRHLSFNFFLLNLLAFLIHQIASIVDRDYRAATESTGTRADFWECARSFLFLFKLDDFATLFKLIARRDTFAELDPASYLHPT